MSMEGGASGSIAVTDSTMAEAGAVDPALALGVFSLMFAASTHGY
jgi:26S proteasome regulatory subunit N10